MFVAVVLPLPPQIDWAPAGGGNAKADKDTKRACSFERRAQAQNTSDTHQPTPKRQYYWITTGEWARRPRAAGYAPIIAGCGRKSPHRRFREIGPRPERPCRDLAGSL